MFLNLPIMQRRCFDWVLGSLLLLLFCPLFFLLWASHGFSLKKTFFGHTRVGHEGKAFTCWKFRTMYADAELHLDHVLQSSDAVRQEWHAKRKLSRDPRITPLGYWLRKSSIDELPQLFNVLLGNMSLVGPRPVTNPELAYYGPHVAEFLSVRPGITGLWQVKGRNQLSFEQRVALDLEYIRTQSLELDVWILLKTIPVVVGAKGAL